MLNNKPYNASLDIWCLGVLLYELLHGSPPFGGKMQADKMKKIKASYKNKIDFGASKISIEVQELIGNLLKYFPEERYTIQDVLNDKWILDWKTRTGVGMELSNSSRGHGLDWNFDKM
jgi:serine/threonine protein kinase